MQAIADQAGLHPYTRFIRISCVTLTLVLLAMGLFWVFGVPSLTAAGSLDVAASLQDPGEGVPAELQAALRPEIPVPVAPSSQVPWGGGDQPIGHLAIPALGIDGVIYPLGYAKDGKSMGTTEDAWTVAWWKLGVFPGKPGDSVITCHNHWYTGAALCGNLYTITPGAEIDVKLATGTVQHFTVDSTQTVPWTTPAVPGLFDTGGPPRLSVITCGGTWDVKLQTYSLRVIVNAHLTGSTT